MRFPMFHHLALGFSAGLALLASAALGQVGGGHHAHHDEHPAPEPTATESRGLRRIPDAPLVDQDGEEVRFYSDLVADKVVAVNFIFTSCTTVCPPMGAIFGKLRESLGERAGRDVHLVSVSVDPVTDTPERLKAWSERFGAGPGWTLVTGRKHDVDELLKSLEVFTPDFADHSPTVLVGNDRTGTWKRAYGLAQPARLAELIDEMSASDDPPSRGDGAAAGLRYFTDVVLVNQDGEPMRLYSDLLRDRVVVISPFFTTCEGVCPILSQKLATFQEHLGDRLGRDVFLISISVDPETDTVGKLKAYAERFKARPGWYFLAGRKENVDFALYKLGQYVEDKEAHTNILILGNEATRTWRKLFGLSPTESLLRSLDEFLGGQG